MIKHSLKDDTLYISIAKRDFSYRIPLKKIGDIIDWRIGGKGKEGIVINGVSAWTLQLFTKKTTEFKYIKQFKSIVQEHCPNSAVNWEETLLAVNMQNEYNWLILDKKKNSKTEIISSLKKKYKLG